MPPKLFMKKKVFTRQVASVLLFNSVGREPCPTVELQQQPGLVTNETFFRQSEYSRTGVIGYNKNESLHIWSCGVNTELVFASKHANFFFFIFPSVIRLDNTYSELLSGLKVQSSVASSSAGARPP